MPNRDDFTPKTKEQLAKRVGYHCSNPNCGVSTVAASDANSYDSEYVGVAAHIYSASVDKGPRAKPSLTEEQRKDISNGIHLCNKCSTLIDKNNGNGYPAKLLFDWKDKAVEKARHRVYKSSLLNQFKLIKFKNLESNYSSALTCSGLGETNVLSCPFNDKYIHEISTNLELGYKLIIRGESGSGKSLLTFQVAKNFFDNGWKIYKLDKNIINDDTVSLPDDKAFIIIDDAQTLTLEIFEDIIETANENSIVLLNWNTNTLNNEEFLRSYPCIEISASQQVAMITQFSLKNKEHISEKLKQIGLKVNNHDWFDNIDSRIKKASKEKTPWLFNYSLTEGWKQAKNDMDYLRDQDHLDLVMLVVAVYQFVTLDKGISEEVILNELRNYNHEEEWISKTKKIINEYCISFDGLIRHKHYLYAREVLRIFIDKEKDNKSRDFSINLFKQILLNQEFEFGYRDILEFIMFEYEYCDRHYKKDKFIYDLTNNLFEKSLATDTIKIRNLNSCIRFDSGVLSIVEENIEVINQWIMSCDRSTAIVLQDLINTLYNGKSKVFTLTNEMLESLINKIIDSEIKDKSRYSSVYDRLHLFSTDEQRKYCKQRIEKANLKLNLSNCNEGIEYYHFSKLITNIGRTSNHWANECISMNIRIIANAFNNNLLKAYSLYKDILLYHFGLIGLILGGGKKKDSILAKKLIKLIKSEIIIDTGMTPIT